MHMVCCCVIKGEPMQHVENHLSILVITVTEPACVIHLFVMHAFLDNVEPLSVSSFMLVSLTNVLFHLSCQVL